MRTRQEIENDYQGSMRLSKVSKEEIIIELLLDIRELLECLSTKDSPLRIGYVRTENDNCHCLLGTNINVWCPVHGCQYWG